MLIFFWAQGGATPEPTPSSQTPTYGWLNWRNIGRQQSKDEVRRERERLGIVPKQAKRIEKLADKLAAEIEVYEPNRVLVQIKASEDYQKLLKILAERDQGRRMEIAEFVAAQILYRIDRIQEEEDRAIVTLLMQM